MTTPSMPSSCHAETARRLREVERGRASDAAAELRAVGVHLAACAGCRARHGGRHAEAEARWALRQREAPEDLFEGFFETVQQRVAHAPPGGGISPAFLDAPRSLRMWRAVALAGMVVVGLGAGYVMNVEQGGPAPATGERRLEQVPSPLLQHWNRGSTLVTQPAPEGSAERYFDLGREEGFEASPSAGAPIEHWD